VKATPTDDHHDVVPTSRGRMPFAHLTWDAQPREATAVVLVLHGGAVDGREPNFPWSHNVARLVPFARSLARADGRLAVARVRFRYRGWNGTEAAPLVDARWALEQVRAAYPGVPVAVVGHSMGGRVALHLGAEPEVRLVVALAPWVEAGDARPASGCRTVVVHGDRDVICGLSRSRRMVEQMVGQGQAATLVRVARSDHAMLVRAPLWTRVVTGVVTEFFAGESGPERRTSASGRGEIAAAVALAAHGPGGVIDL
jgi:pimeloyl-ACP methyl ester carboxylesterase